MKVTEQYFPVVLFNMLYKVVLTIEYVDEILKYDHSHVSPFNLSRSFSLRTALMPVLTSVVLIFSKHLINLFNASCVR